jgi:tetratricopeptide (TPR) repeat protein/transcriptional regulator with XRE-family HTH domain
LVPSRGNVPSRREGLGALLRDRRLAVSLTQEDLADRTGLSVRAISDLERGQTARPYRRSAWLIADALGLSGEARVQFLAAAGAPPRPDRHDSTAGPGSSQPLPVVPRQLPGAQRNFAGRAAELKRLDALLDRDDSQHGPNVVAITGTAGVGKTALAIHWAHQVADRFPDGQLYIDLRGFDPSASRMSAEAVVRTFLDALQVPQSRIPGSLDAQIGLYRSLLADRRCQIVLDNAFDPAHVRNLLPASPFCLVIVTSRAEMTSLAAAAGAELITLDVLSDGDAREMVTNRLGRERVAGEPGAVQEMIGLCARLPLAVSIAVARAAARPNFPLAVLADELADVGHRLDALEVDDATASVRAVFSWSCQSLSDPAARMFRLLSEQPGPDISGPAAASLAGVPREQAQAALRELARSHLVSERAPGRFAFHDLLRAFACEQASVRDGDGERWAAGQRLLDHYLHTCLETARVLDPTRDPIPLGAPAPGVQPEQAGSYQQSWSWLDAEYRVLLAVADLAVTARPGKHGWQIPWLMQTFLFRRGHWQDFVTLQRRAVDVAVRLADVEGQAYAHHGLGRSCGLTGSYQEADEHLSLALRLFRQLGQRTAEARCRIDMGHVAARQGRYDAALDQARQAEQLYRLAGHQSGQAGALNNIGWYRIHLGEYASALDYCQQALARFEAAGSQHGAATSLASLGAVYHRLGDPARGIACCERALACIVKHGDLPSQAEIFLQLGEIHDTNGDPGTARECLRRALAIYTDLNHPEAAVLRGKLGEYRTDPRQPL